MHIGIDINLWAMVWIASAVVGLCALALACIIAISFTPEIEELLSKIHAKINKQSDKS
jgi:hypothetical protein